MKAINILMPVALIALILVGCSKAPGCGESPPAVASKWKPMTNDEIIAETKKCESADLSAEALKVEAEFGSQTVLIQCQPKQSKETK